MKPYQVVERELRQRAKGWWTRIVHWIPELVDLQSTPQPPQYHAEGDVAAHTRLALKTCPPDCDPDLLWAVLLHDIGKPAVTKVTGSRITSHGHHRVGAEIAAAVLKRLDMPDDRRQRITWAVRHHMFHFFWNLTDPKQASPRHKAFVAGENFPLLLQLLDIDAKASQGGPTKDAAVEFYRKLRASVLNGGGDDH